MDKKLKIQELQSHIKIREEEAKLKNLEIISLKKELFELEWTLMSWDALEQWLKDNRPDNIYEKNPQVRYREFDGTPATYCKLNSEGKLQVGPYKRSDGFTPGEKIRVHHEFKNWR